MNVKKELSTHPTPVVYSQSLAFRIYATALKAALHCLAHGDWKNGIKLLTYPVGYWRFMPNALTFAAAEGLGSQPLRILDVSSPKVVSLALGKKHDITAIDLDDPNLETRWKKTALAMGLQHYQTQFANAWQLPLPSLPTSSISPIP